MKTLSLRLTGCALSVLALTVALPVHAQTIKTPQIEKKIVATLHATGLLSRGTIVGTQACGEKTFVLWQIPFVVRGSSFVVQTFQNTREISRRSVATESRPSFSGVCIGDLPVVTMFNAKTKILTLSPLSSLARPTSEISCPSASGQTGCLSTIDGRTEKLGKLTKDKTKIVGSSLVDAFDDRGRVITFRPPWYKDLAKESLATNETLTANFSRIAHGFRVVETIATEGQNASNAHVRQYEILDGQKTYHEVQPPACASSGPQDAIVTDKNGLSISLARTSCAANNVAQSNGTRWLIHGVAVRSSASFIAPMLRKDEGGYHATYVINDRGRLELWRTMVRK